LTTDDLNKESGISRTTILSVKKISSKYMCPCFAYEAWIGQYMVFPTPNLDY